MVLDKIKDKTVYKSDDLRQSETVLDKILKTTELKDIWREMKGDDRRYTAVYKSYSRIDFIFVSQSLISKIINTDINVIKITDHALMSMEMETKKNYREARR